GSGFAICSVPGAGVALMATLWPGTPPVDGPPLASGINVAYPGERVSGDAWALKSTPDRTVILMSDGLGHGAPAAEASKIAVTIFRQRIGLRPPEILQQIHEGLRPTRGAAIGVAEVDSRRSDFPFTSLSTTHPPALP